MRRAPAHVIGRVGIGLRGAVAQVVARDEAAHAVADDVELRARVPAGVGQGGQRLVEAPRRFHEVAPPVVGKDVLGHPGRAGGAGGPEAHRGQQLEQVVVLGEPEQAGDDLVGSQQRARREIVLALPERKHERKRQLVLPDGVADVQPDAGAVRTEQARSHDAGEDHHRRDAVAVARVAEEPGIETAPVRPRVGEGQRGAARADAGEERFQPAATRPSAVSQRTTF